MSQGMPQGMLSDIVALPALIAGPMSGVGDVIRKRRAQQVIGAQLGRSSSSRAAALPVRGAKIAGRPLRADSQRCHGCR
ncbi:MAG: hypothetical protein PHQ28_17880 [Mycobacterium sp.]|nr:hypothetical protein [Mycobacterium sp.]